MPKLNIKHFEKIVPDAFHGTSLQNAKDICDHGFKLSLGDDQYFGDGVYFFESSCKHAVNWAEKHSEEAQIGVLKCTIALGKCLDLINWDHRNFIKQTATKLKKKSSHKKITDAVVINFIATNFAKVDVVRGIYARPDYGLLFDGSKHHDYLQLMLCVRNVDNILAIHLIYNAIKK